MYKMVNSKKMYVGKGGDCPGIDCVTCKGQITTVAVLNEGQSVYSIQFTPYDDTLRVGLRNGHIKQYWHDPESDKLVELETIDQGSSVVSVSRYDSQIYGVGS